MVLEQKKVFTKQQNGELTMIEKDTDLIIAFVMREAQDYNPPRDKDWILKVVETIHNKIPDNLGRLKLTSIGNSGVVVRELTLYNAGKVPCQLLVDTDGEGTVNRVE